MKKDIKWAVTVICVLAAGVCYSCGGMNGRGDTAGEKTLVLTAETVSGESAEDIRSTEALRQGEGPDDPSLTDAPSLAETESSGKEVSATDGGDLSAEASCFVHICGAVAVPGVYELPAGSRIFEVVEMAGGFTEDAASSWLNLAQEIADGMKIAVPSEAELAAQAAGGVQGGAGVQSGGASGCMAVSGEAVQGGSGYGIFGAAESTPSEEAEAGRKVNINTAGKEELMTLKGIGEARAEAVIRYREEHGPFQTIEDIMKVSGIKSAAFDKIRDDITV